MQIERGRICILDQEDKVLNDSSYFVPTPLDTVMTGLLKMLALYDGDDRKSSPVTADLKLLFTNGHCLDGRLSQQEKSSVQGAELLADDFPLEGENSGFDPFAPLNNRPTA